RSARARERARVDVGEPPSPQRHAESGGLPPAQLGERHILAPLEPANGVRDRLPMAREQEPRGQTLSSEHSGSRLPRLRQLYRSQSLTLSRAASAVLSRARVSALPRMDITWKMGGLAALPVRAMRASWARSTSLTWRSAASPRNSSSSDSGSMVGWASSRLIRSA